MIIMCDAKSASSDEMDGGYVKLISSDDHIFFIPRELIRKTSRKLMEMVTVPPKPNPGVKADPDSETSEIKLCYKSRVVQKVCHYMQYKERYSNTQEDIPDFNVQSEDALTLLDAAIFLEL